MILSALYAHETISPLLRARPQHRDLYHQPHPFTGDGNERLPHTARKSLVLATLIGLLLSSAGLAESSQISDAPGTVSSLISVTQSASQDLTQDGFEFLKEMSEAANNLKTYSFQSEQIVFKGNKSIREKVNFYFKKPKLIRAEEVGDYKKGSVAVLQKNGSVRGHLGGLLSKINATVASDSEWVLGANGYPLADSDFYSMSQVMVNFVKDGKKSLVTGSPVKATGQPKPVYIIELYTDTSKKQLMKRAYIDPENLLPVEWFDYKDGKLFAHTIWRNLHINTELNDSLFQL